MLTHIDVFNYGQFKQLASGSKVLLVTHDEKKEQAINTENGLLEEIMVVQHILQAILPELGVIAFHKLTVDVPNKIDYDDDEAIEVFEANQRKKLFERLKQDLSPDIEFVHGTVKPEGVVNYFDYDAMSTLIRVIRNIGVLDDPVMDELPKSDVIICPGCHAQLYYTVKECPVCGKRQFSNDQGGNDP